MVSGDSDIQIEVQTSSRISDWVLAEKLLTTWPLASPETAPNRWGLDEIARNSLSYEDGLEALRKNWSADDLAPILKRSSAPRALYVFDWPVSGRDPRRRFFASVRSSMSKKFDIGAIEALVRLFAEFLQPEYIAITSVSDAFQRHYLPVSMRMPSGVEVPGMQYQGHEVNGLLPGIYWRTCIDATLVQHFIGAIDSMTFLSSVPGYSLSWEGKMLVFQSSAKLSEFSADNWLPAQRHIEKHLGRKIFHGPPG